MNTTKIIAIASAVCGAAGLACSFSSVPWAGGLLALCAGLLGLDAGLRRGGHE